LAKHAANTGNKRNAYRDSVGKPKGQKPLGTPRNTANNITMILKNGME
jgi:hypothetical protein